MRLVLVLLLWIITLFAEGTPGELRSRIRGDVVVIEASNPEEIRARIAVRFGVQPSAMIDRRLCVESVHGHSFMRDVIEASPGCIQSVELHKPSLEDVFIHETGEFMAQADETTRDAAA
jgi:ABC-2 type transport system ATP-binding protein